MESVNMIVEDVEHYKTGSRNSTIEDEDDTPDMVILHCDESQQGMSLELQ